MNILVIPAYAIADTKYSIPDFSSWPEASVDCTNPDAIISMSISKMKETKEAVRKYPGTPLFCYNWDCYEWAIDNPRPGEYSYKAYGQLLRSATEIWVPSHCTGLRMQQWWSIKNWKVILSAVPYWEYDDVRDEGYALCTLREIPDKWWGRFEKTCDELSIPYKMTLHTQSYAEYQKAVAHCRFICSPLYELSTGGLSLVEAYYLGKPCLLSNSKWHGGRDYFGERATYFGEFADALQRMYTDTPIVAKDHREFVEKLFSDECMVQQMKDRIAAYV